MKLLAEVDVHDFGFRRAAIGGDLQLHLVDRGAQRRAGGGTGRVDTAELRADEVHDLRHIGRILDEHPRADHVGQGRIDRRQARSILLKTCSACSITSSGISLVSGLRPAVFDT